MNRQISILGIVQVLVVVLGFLALVIHMKFLGYPSAPEEVMRWGTTALFLREYGLFFLLVPPFWTALAICAARRDAGVFSYQPAILLGIFLLMFMLCLFLYAVRRPGVRPLLIFAPAPSPTPQHTQQTVPPNP